MIPTGLRTVRSTFAFSASNAGNRRRPQHQEGGPAGGIDCRALATGVFDPERDTSLDEVLATLDLPTRRFQAGPGSGFAAEVFVLGMKGFRVTVMPASRRATRSPDRRKQRAIAVHGGRLEN
jgi:hypothetical protein